MPERSFTESEVISMLEALRQRCAEKIKLGDTVLQLQNKINRVEYRDLIPPLTKQ
jgi:hypothetical protein